VWTVKESSPTSPMWFCSFQEHLHFWKNWITDPVAMQRHNNTDPLARERDYLQLPRERVYLPLPRERVYRVVSSGTCVQSRCPGKVLTEPLLARVVRKPARATPGVSTSFIINNEKNCINEVGFEVHRADISYEDFYRLGNNAV
jgi:hypothetical protein